MLLVYIYIFGEDIPYSKIHVMGSCREKNALYPKCVTDKLRAYLYTLVGDNNFTIHE